MSDHRPSALQPQRPLVIACAALTNDLRAVLGAAGLDDAIEIDYLPASLHNHPERIVEELRPKVEGAVAHGRPVFVAYADCGTGGRLDAFLDQHPGVSRLPGAHCYEVFAGTSLFASLHDDEPGTFYLTDFLAKHFDALVWSGLGLDRAPQLRDTYFGNYRRLVLLAQSDDDAVTGRARLAADRLQLEFERRLVGRHHLADPIVTWSGSLSGTMAVAAGAR